MGDDSGNSRKAHQPATFTSSRHSEGPTVLDVMAGATLQVPWNKDMSNVSFMRLPITLAQHILRQRTSGIPKSMDWRGPVMYDHLSDGSPERHR